VFSGTGIAAITSLASPAPAATSPAIYVLGVSVEFIIFSLTLLGVAVFHHTTLQGALAGLAGIALYKLILTDFKAGTGPTALGLGFLSSIFGNIPLTRSPSSKAAPTGATSPIPKALVAR
jgi:hypothetical protein